jgi:hypothetical protein
VRVDDGVKDWLGCVGDLTREHRAARAAELRARRAARRLELVREGKFKSERDRSWRWYTLRERGHTKRVECVRACGSKVLRINCQACGLVHDRVAGCRVGLLCFTCRKEIAAAKRIVFLRARADVLADADRRGLLRQARRGGRFGEKFLTLTTPRVPGDTVVSRIVRVLIAWGFLLKRLNAHFRSIAVRSAEWFRVFEWTLGEADDLGHPHLHIWIFSPFIPVDLVRSWWVASLVDAGCPAELAAHPIIDLREVHGADGGARELIKYLTKDTTSGGQKLAPEIYAEVYKALEGRRATQASSGFMGRAKRAERACDCGATLPKRVRLLPRDEGSTSPILPKGSAR